MNKKVFVCSRHFNPDRDYHCRGKKPKLNYDAKPTIPSISQFRNFQLELQKLGEKVDTPSYQFAQEGMIFFLSHNNEQRLQTFTRKNNAYTFVFSDFRIPNGNVSNQYQIESSLFTSSTSASTSTGTPTPSTSVGTPSVPSISKYFLKPLRGQLRAVCMDHCVHAQCTYSTGSELKNFSKCCIEES